MRGVAIFAVLFIAPVLVSAAGFAKQSLFLSKSPVTEGETVLIHAVVANDTAEKFKGEVQLKSGDTKIGAVPVTLERWRSAHGLCFVESRWPALTPCTAELKAGDGVVAESEQATFVVLEIPKPAVAGTSTTAIPLSPRLKSRKLLPISLLRWRKAHSRFLKRWILGAKRGPDFLINKLPRAKKNVPKARSSEQRPYKRQKIIL